MSAQNKIVIGALPFHPPFSSQADTEGHFYGFDISLMNEVCRRLDLTCVYTSKNFRQLFSSINDDSIDLAVGGMTVTKERQKKYLFSIPYLMSYGSFLVLQGSPYKTVDELTSQRVGTVSGSVYETLLETQYGAQVTVKTYEYVTDILSALLAKEIDAALIDTETATFWSIQESKLVLISPPLQTGNGYAIMASQKNEALINKINTVILDMENDGTYIKLYNQFFSP